MADRFHLLKNLTEVVERVLVDNRAALHAAAEAVLQQRSKHLRRSVPQFPGSWASR